MKIVIDARLYGLENAGLGRYAINLVDQLARLDNKNNYVLLLRRKYFETLRTPKNFEKVLADFRHYSLAEQTKLPGLIKGLNPDLTHFLHFNVPLGFRGKYVVTIHDLLMHKETGRMATTLPVAVYSLKRLGYKAVFSKAVREAEKVIVPSKAVEREVIDYYHLSSNKVVSIYEGVDPKFFVEEPPVPGDYFVYVGNAYPHKNILRAIEAARGIDTILRIVSARGVFVDRLKKEIERLDAQKHVKLHNFLSDQELIELYKNSAGFVYPSLSEGFGLPGLEAMASGTLVLASEIPVFREVYKDNAIYFNPFDFTSIQKAMKEVLNMPIPVRRKFVRKAQKDIRCYSWSQMAKETLLVYNSAVK